MIEAHVVLCMTEPDFLRKKNWSKNGKMGQRYSLLNLFKEVHIISCILAQIPHLGKIWFLRYGPKSSRPVKLKKPDFLHVDTNSWKLKVHWKIFRWVWSKVFVAALVSGHWNWLHLKNELMKWTDFFACWYKFRKAKNYFNNYWLGMVKNRRGLIYHETLKTGVPHKWFDKLCRLIEWFLHADSHGIIFGVMANLLCIFGI